VMAPAAIEAVLVATANTAHTLPARVTPEEPAPKTRPPVGTPVRARPTQPGTVRRLADDALPARREPSGEPRLIVAPTPAANRDTPAEALPAAIAGPTGGSAGGVSPDDLRQYRVSLAVAARRFKRYPVLARERGWEGRVEVTVSMSAWQPRPLVSLARSSGRATLDEQAITMLERASANTALPEGLKGREFSLLLPIEFTLDEDR